MQPILLPIIIIRCTYFLAGVGISPSSLIVLLAIFILGGDSIRSFSFAMILGVVFGTLSSLFIAAPVAYLTLGRTIKEEGEIPTPAKK